MTLRNISVIGPNLQRRKGYAQYVPAFEFEAAFSIRDTTENARVEDCFFRNVYGDGVYVGGAGRPNTGTVIRNVSGVYSGRQGLAMVNVDGLVAENMSCDYAAGVGVDIEPLSGQYVRNVTLSGVAVGAQHYPYSIGGAADAAYRENITVDGCTAIRSLFEYCALTASSPGRGLKIINHVDMRQESEYGITVKEWDDISIVNCQITTRKLRKPTIAVKMDKCGGVISLLNNDFRGTEGGFDQLYTDEGLVVNVQHSGNLWDAGRARD